MHDALQPLMRKLNVQNLRDKSRVILQDHKPVATVNCAASITMKMLRELYSHVNELITERFYEEKHIQLARFEEYSRKEDLVIAERKFCEVALARSSTHSSSIKLEKYKGSLTWTMKYTRSEDKVRKEWNEMSKEEFLARH